MKKNNKNVVYENQWCKVVYAGGCYILQSKSGKYNDQYYRDLQEVAAHTGISVRELYDYSHPQNNEAGQSLAMFAIVCTPLLAIAYYLAVFMGWL